PGSSKLKLSFLPGFQKIGPWGQQASILTRTLRLHKNSGITGNNHRGDKRDAIDWTVRNGLSRSQVCGANPKFGAHSLGVHSTTVATDPDEER
ncbi:mCG1028661, partial [Mus musculus]